MKLFSAKENLVIEISVKADPSIGFLPIATTEGEDYFLSITQWYKSEELLWFAVGQWAVTNGFQLDRPIAFKKKID